MSEITCNNTADTDFADKVLQWFAKHGRKDLPWQQDINAYRVWVSEIMLQQTQVNTVIPYFKRFMQSFPQINDLARACDDQVMHHWSGLGYYSRARNLHKTAKRVCDDYESVFPNDVDSLTDLPGIGRSTAGAIAAIAYQQPAAILDGNVKRVLARHFAIEGWPGNSQVSKQLWALSEAVTPKQPTHIAAYTQAIMDLGATLCTRSKPRCEDCPIQTSCQAKANDSVANYPGKKPKKTLPVKSTTLLVIQNNQGEILLEKRPPTGIWGSLWSLPEQAPSFISLDTLKGNKLPSFRHTFSHFHLEISPVHYCMHLDKDNRHHTLSENDRLYWFNPDKPEQLGLPAPISQILLGLPQ